MDFTMAIVESDSEADIGNAFFRRG
ncbi:hypothetical protein IL54_1267 [Sphingobium sp. ba1]|nr:hypothetical protein IL54_1267 [Sphingobium sp. ba1]